MDIPPTQVLSLSRIMAEVTTFAMNPPPGIILVPDESSMTVVHVLIIGVPGTPYAGGFFYFVVNFPPDYPFNPPCITCMTTGGSKVRFNPNIYQCGTVRLNILEDGWDVTHTLSSLLVSIQGLLNDKPYHNEPGYEEEKNPCDVEKYNQIIIHETLRVAVVGMINNDFGVVMPEGLQLVMKKHFLDHHFSYRQSALSQYHLNGKSMKDPFRINSGKFDYEFILQRLQQLEVTLSSLSSVVSSNIPTPVPSPNLPLNYFPSSQAQSAPASAKVTNTAKSDSRACVARIMKEIMKFEKDPPPGIKIAVDEANCTTIHALIFGPVNTPYEGGFFYFVLNFPPSYPWTPPQVTFMTTAGGTVRFNPNLYADGKVCLSILGTWDGPVWTPVITISVLLVSIQSLLNEKPYHNEPGFEKEIMPGHVDCYNQIIRHETLRVAVVGMLDNDFGIVMPERLQSAMKEYYLNNYLFYNDQAQLNSHLNGKIMIDPFWMNRGFFDYKSTLQRLEQINKRLMPSL